MHQLCQRFLVNDKTNQKGNINCKTNMHDESHNHMITWSDVRFYTVNQLRKKFNQSFDGKFKQDLVNMFNDMTRIENCFDKEKTHFKNYFCNKLKPNFSNMELVKRLVAGIDHYLKCQRQKCHICVNPRKKKSIQRIQASLDMKSNDCSDVIRHILQQVSKYFEAKYQIIASKRGTLGVEIVLFCYLGVDIVGVPITLNRHKTKWLIRTILVSEMKHNTMLPQLLLGRNQKYKLCVFCYLFYIYTTACLDTVDLFL